MSDPSAVYTREWYEHDFADLRPEFRLVAEGINRWRRNAGRWGAIALDIGCGPGMVVAELARLGWCARGFDGSAHAIAYAEQHVQDAVGLIVQANILDERWPIEADRSRNPELAICTEVAEHLEAEHALTLVRRLVGLEPQAIVFTAAPPGQGGHHHVNEQPPEYWASLFAEQGWLLDDDGTRELRARWQKLQRLSHMTRNVMVLR